MRLHRATCNLKIKGLGQLRNIIPCSVYFIRQDGKEKATAQMIVNLLKHNYFTV